MIGACLALPAVVATGRTLPVEFVAGRTLVICPAPEAPVVRGDPISDCPPAAALISSPIGVCSDDVSETAPLAALRSSLPVARPTSCLADHYHLIGDNSVFSLAGY